MADEVNFEVKRAREGLKFVKEYIRSLKLDFEAHTHLDKQLQKIEDFVGCDCHNKSKIDPKQEVLNVLKDNNIKN